MDSNFHRKPLTSETGSSESSGRRLFGTDKLEEGPQHRCYSTKCPKSSFGDLQARRDAFTL